MPRIGGLESLNFQLCTNLSNTPLLFTKFMKKGNIKGCLMLSEVIIIPTVKIQKIQSLLHYNFYLQI